MPLASRDRFATACRGADRSAVTDLVAALYEARGYEVERPAEGLLRLQPGGRTLAVRPSDTSDLPPDVDAIVRCDGREWDGTVPVVDADALHRQLCYAVDRSVARDLLATHLGVEACGRSDGASDARATPVHGRVSALLAAVAAVALLGALAAAGVAELPGSVTDPATSTATPTPAPTPTASQTPATATAREPGTPAVGGNGERLPPGVGYGGIRDVDRLVAAHRTRLAGKSFTMRISHREFVDGQLTGVYVETIRVENASRYSVAASKTGILRATPQAIAGTDLFVSGDRRYINTTVVGSYFRSRATPARFRRQIEQYLRWSLSAEQSTVTDTESTANGTVYRLATEGDTYGVFKDASGTAYITEQGLVTFGRWTYRPPDKEAVRVEFTVRTTRVGSTTVSRPGWVEER